MRIKNQPKEIAAMAPSLIMLFIFAGYLIVTIAVSIIIFHGHIHIDAAEIVLFVFFLFFAFAVYLQAVKLHKLYSGVFLKSVELAKNDVSFNFNRQCYNFKCSYEEIKQAEIAIETFKSAQHPALIIREISLNFVLVDNKKLSISNFAHDELKFIYCVIDFLKQAKNFSYKFTGAGEIKTIKQKIENYIQTGAKQLYTTRFELANRILSIWFFSSAIALFLYFGPRFKSIFNSIGMAFFITPALFIMVSFCIDIALLAAKIREKRQGFVKIEKFSIESIYITKLIIAAMVFAYCLV